MTTVHDYVDYFKKLQKDHGDNCFEAPGKLKKLTNLVHAHIRGHCCYKEVIKRIVRAACSYYLERRKDEGKNDTLDNNNNFDNDSPMDGTTSSNIGVLVLAAHLCQKYEISDDPWLVTEVLRHVFREDGGFDRLFCFLDPLIFPYEIDQILFPVTGDYYIIEDYHVLLNIVGYFLKTSAHLLHVNSTYTEVDFTSNRVPPRIYTLRLPMVDAPLSTCRGSTPLLLACHSINPDAVLLLLRHGANPLRRGQAHQIIGLQFQHPLYVIVSKLNSCLFWSSRQPLMDPVQLRRFQETQKSQKDDLKRCLRYFCRALPKVPIAFRDEPQAQTDRGIDSGVFYLSSEYKHLLPADRYREPASLTHLCRCFIRGEMLKARWLPRGLQFLDIPRHLQYYMDLLQD